MGQELPGVFVIGSSTTLLFGPYLRQMLAGRYHYARKGEEPDQIRRAFSDLDRPQGASAGDSAMVLAYLAELDQAPSFHPDVVLLSVGLHDLRRDAKTGRSQVPLDDYVENVDAIVDWFQRKEIRLVWISNGPLDEALHNARSKGFRRFQADLDAYNAGAEAILERRRVPILDLRGFMENLAPLDQLLKDHVHYRDEVVRLQAAFIAGYLMGLAGSGGPTSR